MESQRPVTTKYLKGMIHRGIIPTKLTKHKLRVNSVFSLLFQKKKLSSTKYSTSKKSPVYYMIAYNSYIFLRIEFLGL
jgi:hypothetical protein